MPETLRCHVFCVTAGVLYPGALDVPLPENARAGSLANEIAKLQNTTPAQIVIWKPKERIVSGEYEKLRGLLARKPLAEFCYRVTHAADPTRTIKSLVSPGTNSRTSTFTALIAEIFSVPTPIAAKIEAGDDEELEEIDYLSKMKTDFETVLTAKRDTPSQSCQPLKYAEYQTRITPVYDGRYAQTPNTTAAPIEIFHPVFAYFLGCLRDYTLEINSSLLRKTYEVMRSTSKIATLESQREKTTRDFLADILQCDVHQIVIDHKAIPDHSVPHNLAGKKVTGNAGLAIVEEKSELGVSGDGLTQGTFSYIILDFSRPESKPFGIPPFVHRLAGPWMAISGAIFTSGVIVQRLTDYIWLGYSRVLDHRRVLEIARAFLALQLSIKRLRAWYDDLSGIPSDHRYFPLATSFTAEGKTVNFRYQKPLKNTGPTCIVFLATEVGGDRKFVVKFVERYGEDVHRELAAMNRAPKLLYCGSFWSSVVEQLGVGDMKMVVMEYLKGKTLAKWKKMPPSVRQSVKLVISALHKKDWVHGDIRPPNVMILNSEDELEVPEADRVRILDFDWAGEEGVVHYPSDLAMDTRPASAGDYMPILKEHDLAMTDYL
ncbi:hypothetical protein D9757_007645 [Collybiopsis confluens]|uniref:Protein kinase domain-containing protein n=1 Tax=Collybiopsis confluens TaxID=2823264 RepID=A0A8H5H9V4_9AGAR|nr:hypothetical protein D9757_007645 [Collybiopsis confluens]